MITLIKIIMKVIIIIIKTFALPRRGGGQMGANAPPIPIRSTPELRVNPKTLGDRVGGGGGRVRRKVKQNNESNDIHRRFFVPCNRLNKFITNGPHVEKIYY